MNKKIIEPIKAFKKNLRNYLTGVSLGEFNIINVALCNQPARFVYFMPVLYGIINVFCFCTCAYALHQRITVKRIYSDRWPAVMGFVHSGNLPLKSVRYLLYRPSRGLKRSAVMRNVRPVGLNVHQFCCRRRRS